MHAAQASGPTFLSLSPLILLPLCFLKGPLFLHLHSMQDHEFEFGQGLAGKVRVNDTSLGFNWRKEAALAPDRWAGLALAGSRHPLFQRPARCAHYLALEILNPVGGTSPHHLLCQFSL